MRRYTYKKHYEWDKEIAYLCGLIASDGCLINNSRHINLTSKDTELIALTQRILGISVRVQEKISSNNGAAFHLQFSNVALYDFLVRAGLTPAKSKTLGVINVPDRYYGHFLRGYFDGDGCVYGFIDKRWKNSHMYYCEFASASPTFLQWLSQRNQRLANVTGGRIKKSTRVEALSYAKADSRRLFSYMYNDSEGLKLTRKYTKFVDFLLNDPYPVEALARVLESGRQATLRS